MTDTLDTNKTTDTPRYVDLTLYDVDKFYEMDPQTEDVIFGSELRDHMRVIIEDKMSRADTEHLHSRYDSERARENNRWCLVTDLRRRYVGDDNTLVSFIGLYDDGTKKSRTYSEAYAWIVKQDTMPTLTSDTLD